MSLHSIMLRGVTEPIEVEEVVRLGEEARPPVIAALHDVQAHFTLKAGLETLFGRPVDLVTGSNLANPYIRGRVIAERGNVYAR